MLNKTFINRIKKEYGVYDASRRIIVQQSNEILKLSKQAIFAVHRDEIAGAQTLLREAEKKLRYLDTVIKKDKQLSLEGSYKVALEEYAEARLFYSFIVEGKIGGIKEFPMTTHAYIGGLSDLTGEILRYALRSASVRNHKEIQRYHRIVEEIFVELMQMNITGSLRSKFDQANSNVKKLEGILYDLRIKE